MVGRARELTGPYVDETGKPLTEGCGAQLLLPNDRWLGPGGESLLVNSGEKGIIVFHAYDAKTGKPSLQISTVEWTGGDLHAVLADQ
jgi:arabinan endo-1,5-alpha-L-arabinosidase